MPLLILTEFNGNRTVFLAAVKSRLLEPASPYACVNSPSSSYSCSLGLTEFQFGTPI